MSSQLALACMSHSPLMPVSDPSPEVQQRVDDAVGEARAFVEAFDPDLVLLFFPDHYLGFRYELMPAFCVGMKARALGDYGTQEAELDVDVEAAEGLIRHLLEDDIDIAMSERMQGDHGMSQPMELLLGSSTAKPVVPVFINSVAQPLGPLRRVCRVGASVGEFVRGLDRKVLVMGSGGLSHDPPVPKLREAPPEVAEYIIHKRRTPEEQAAREASVAKAGVAFAAGETELLPLNPELDREVLALFESGDLEGFDRWTNDDLTQQGGSSIHEMRTWVAAHAALGSYETQSTFYEPVPEWIVGFAVTTAR